MTDESKAELKQESAPANSEGVTPESPQVEEGGYVDTESDKVQARINRLTFEKHEARRQAEEFQAKLKELEQKVNQPAQTPNSNLTIEQFDYDQDKYLAALTEQKAAEIAEKKWNQLQESKTQEQQQREVQQKQAAYNQAAQEYAEKNPDYVELWGQMGSAIQSEAVAGFLLDSKIGPQMQHHLLKNYAELQRIQQLPPLAQAAEMGRLEARMSSAPVKNVSKAPDPAEPLDGGIDPNPVKTAKGAKMPL